MSNLRHLKDEKKGAATRKHFNESLGIKVISKPGLNCQSSMIRELPGRTSESI